MKRFPFFLIIPFALCIASPSCIVGGNDIDENGVDTPARNLPEYRFTIPTPIANVKNEDEYFFNYRLQQFAPDTEPFIKETFGSVLIFEDEGFWEHASYTSHVVGFSTNLPALSVVEYGKTAGYGRQTAQNESYFYRHLHYLKDLEADSTYHYRIIAQDYDGKRIVSADRTFRLRKLTPDVVRIPEDMEDKEPPYFLTKDNARYALTQDLTAPALAININAHNVELDLDGHTIVYDDGPPTVAVNEWTDYAYNDNATAGIRAGLWNKTNFKILNGVVKQGRNGGKGFVPVYLFHMGVTYNEIAGLTVDYYGENTGGMVTANGHIHHNVLYDRGSAIEDRHSGVRAIGVSQDYGDPNTIFAFNSLRRFRHCGVGSTSGKVHHNELYSDSFDTNSFALGGGDNVEASNNKIFGMGYLPIGVGWGSNLYVKGNFIYLRGFSPTRRSAEYNRNSSIAGMRLTDGNVKNLLYEDNVVVLKAEEGCTQARGVWGFNAANNENIVYRRNTIKVEALPGNLRNPDKGAASGDTGNPTAYYNDDVNYALAAVTFSERAENFPEGAPIAGPVIFEDNRLIGNVNLVVIGEGYGICNSVWMYRTKLEKIERDSEFFRPVRLGFWYWDTQNNRMVDTECIGFDSREMTPYFFGGSGKMEIRYGESKSMVVKDAQGAPVANKSLALATTPDDGYSQSLRTDANGRLSFDLLTVRHYKYGNSRENGGEVGMPARTDYRQYTFSVPGYKPCTLSAAQLKGQDSITLLPGV
jgi:hypothetical protein